MKLKLEDTYNKEQELLDVINNVFPFISKLNLETGEADVLQDRTDSVYPYEDRVWNNHLEYYINSVLDQEKDMIRKNLSTKNLLNLFQNGEQSFHISIPITEGEIIRWYAVTVIFLQNQTDEKIAYIMAHEPNENSLLKNIINLYVYNNCDYFIYLDAKTDSYSMFSATKDGTPLPPARCSSYSTEIVTYANDFVVPEDREMVIREMKLENVIEALDKKGIHFILCGIIDPIRGYTRKKLTYRYYNKENKTILLSRTDITDIYKQETEHRIKLEEALERAHKDFLTGIYNAHGISENLSVLLSKETGFSALMFIDLDNFKTINDTLGHSKGDEVLCSVAEVLKEGTRKTDLVGRLGGDEFIVFLKNVKTVENAKMCADRVRAGIEKISEKLNIDIKISCSIGMVFTPRDGREYRELLEKADKLLYTSKRKGKNRFTFN